MKKNQGFFTSRASFTLIEMLIVISIIAIISTVVFVNVRSSQLRSRDAQRVADLESLNNAILMYYRENGRFPSLPENCGIYSDNYGWYSAKSSKEAAHWIRATDRQNCLKDKFIDDLSPGFIASLPVDPGPELTHSTSRLNSRGIVYIHTLSPAPSRKECYKIILHQPEIKNNQRYKSIWDPARDGGNNNSIIDGTNVSAWALYSPGCESR